MSDCLSENTLVELAEGRLGAELRARAFAHAERCAACSALLADLARLEVDPNSDTEHPPPSTLAANDTTLQGSAPSQRFEIVRKLGQGGMGLVYEAIDRLRHRRVALKTVGVMDAETLLRFKNEFRAVQDIPHPNLVRLGDLVEENGKWCYTMELVPGEDFLSFVGPDRSRLLPSLRQLISGLHALHQGHKVHRDIKPQNVMVTADGRVVILDFGLIAETDVTDSAVVGTVAYMAPEQAQGEKAEPAADFYSVGVMLYKALTGALPFEGNGLGLIQAKLNGQLVPPGARAADVPANLEALCLALLQRDPAKRPRAAEILRQLSTAEESTSESLSATTTSVDSINTTTEFIGRTAELSQLDTAFAHSRKGHAVPMLIEGESGVGKSALMRHFVDALRQTTPQVVALFGRCYEREAVPYKALDGIVDALSRYLKRLPRASVEALLPRRVAPLLQAFPVLARVEALAAAPSVPVENLDLNEQRRLVYSALRELFARLADRQPLVLAIDDLQWSDADSLSLIAQLLRPPDAPALLLLATTRPLATTAVAGFESTLGRLQELRTLSLGPLSKEATRELAAKWCARAPGAQTAQPIVERLADEAGGHPFLLDALIRHVAEQGPAHAAPRLEEAIAARINALDPPARRLLNLIMIAGSPTEQEILARATELSPEDFDRCTGQLRAGHFIRRGALLQSDNSQASDPNLLESYHDRVRVAVLTQLSPSELQTGHARLAQELERTQSATPESLAMHYAAAGEANRAAAFAEQAAVRAEKALAFARAAELYRLALRCETLTDAEKQKLQGRLGDMLLILHRPEEAVQMLLASAVGDPETGLVQRQKAAEILLRSARFEQGVEVARSVFADLKMSFPSTKAGAVLSLLWLRLLLFLRGMRYTERAEADVPKRDLLRLDAWGAVSFGMFAAQPLAALSSHSQHLLLALRVGEPKRLARALLVEAMGRNMLGPSQWARADRLVEQATALAERIGSPVAQAGICMAQGVMMHQRNRANFAVTLFQRAESLLETPDADATWVRLLVRAGKLIALCNQGRFAEMAGQVDDWLHDASERGDVVMTTNAQIIGVCTALARNQVAQARTLMTELKELAARHSGMTQIEQGIVADIVISLYDEPQRSCARIQSEWAPQLRKGSNARDFQRRQGLLHFEAAAILRSEDPATQLPRLRRIIVQLSRINVPRAQALAASLRATLAQRFATEPDVDALWSAAERAWITAESPLHVAYAKLRRGQARKDAQGQAMAQSAHAEIKQLGVADIERFSGLAIP